VPGELRQPQQPGYRVSSGITDRERRLKHFQSHNSKEEMAFGAEGKEPRKLSAWRPWPLKLDLAFFGIRSLFYRDHMTLHLGKFGRGLLVATDEEGCRLENNDCRRGGQAVIGALLILCTR
jgi:hypothetical protein